MFGVELPLAALFDRPTVARSGRGGRGCGGSDAAAAGATAAGRDRALPLSFAQQRLWFLDQLEPGSVEYNLPCPAAAGTAPLDVAALGAALSALVARHEVLRTRLVAGADGVPHQVIDPPAPVPLPVVDVSGEPDPRGELPDAWSTADARDAVRPGRRPADPRAR